MGNTFPTNLLYPELSYEITGILFYAHNTLGRFAREVQYANLIESKLREEGIPYLREREIPYTKPPQSIRGNRIDFLIDGKILLELKAKPALERTDYEQTQRYLDAAEVQLGLLVNFRERYLRPRRIIRVAQHIRSDS